MKSYQRALDLTERDPASVSRWKAMMIPLCMCHVPTCKNKQLHISRQTHDEWCVCKIRMYICYFCINIINKSPRERDGLIKQSFQGTPGVSLILHPSICSPPNLSNSAFFLCGSHAFFLTFTHSHSPWSFLKLSLLTCSSHTTFTCRV